MWNIDSSHCPTASKQAVRLLPALIRQSQSGNKAHAAAQQVYFSFISQFFKILASRAVAASCWALLQRARWRRSDVGTYSSKLGLRITVSVWRLSTGGRLEGGPCASSPGAVGAIVGSNSHIAEQLPLRLLAARLCSAH